MITCDDYPKGAIRARYLRMEPILRKTFIEITMKSLCGAASELGVVRDAQNSPGAEAGRVHTYLGNKESTLVGCSGKQ